MPQRLSSVPGPEQCKDTDDKTNWKGLEAVCAAALRESKSKCKKHNWSHDKNENIT